MAIESTTFSVYLHILPPLLRFSSAPTSVCGSQETRLDEDVEVEDVTLKFRGTESGCLSNNKKNYLVAFFGQQRGIATTTDLP